MVIAIFLLKERILQSKEESEKDTGDYMERYKRFSKEQIAVANNVNLVEFLKHQNEPLTKSGKDMRWNRNKTVTVNGNRYYKWKEHQGGYPIQFLQEFYGYSFRQAMELLLSFSNDTGMMMDVTPQEEVKKEFILPERNETMKRVYGYLLNARFIDKDVLNEFVKMNMVYEDKLYHNAVFVGYDEEGIPRHAHKRSTYSGKAYRGNATGSDPRYTFHYIGNSNQIYVFEAPIDMLSYISLHKENWKKNSYIALNGLGTQGLEHLLDSHDSLQKVFLCFDHDIAGMEGAERVLDILYNRNVKDTSVIQPRNKDFNEDLKELNGMEPLKGTDNPKYADMTKEMECIKKSELELMEYQDMTHTSIANQFAKIRYSFHREGRYDFCELDKQSERLLKLVLTMEHKLLYHNTFFTDQSRVWEVLKTDYRAYRDTENIGRSVQNIFKNLEEVKTAIDNHENDQTLAGIYRRTASNVFILKLQIRRELVRNMEMNKKLGIEESLRPYAKMIGEDGNVFNLIGICSKVLKKAGYSEKSEEMFERVTSCRSYDEALTIMSEYVNPVGDEQMYDENYDMKMNGY